MSFCSSCGSASIPEANFCSSCGASLRKDGPASVPYNKDAMYQRKNLGVPPEISADFFTQIIAVYCEKKWARWAESVKYMERAYGEEWEKQSNLEKPAVPNTDELDFLLRDVSHLKSMSREWLIDLHNFCVSALRAECLKDIKKYETVRVRPDLELPKDWQAHYENLYQAQLPVLILAVVQHAFIGNPLEGELYEWSNRRAPFAGARVGQKTKLAGAAAIGAAAAFLLGS